MRVSLIPVQTSVASTAILRCEAMLHQTVSKSRLSLCQWQQNLVIYLVSILSSEKQVTEM